MEMNYYYFLNVTLYIAIIFIPDCLFLLSHFNYLCTAEKIRTEYLLACGLKKEKPFFSTFFAPFTDALQKIEIHGENMLYITCSY